MSFIFKNIPRIALAMFAIVFGGFCVVLLQEFVLGAGESPISDIFLSILFVACLIYFTKSIEQRTY